MAIIATRRNCSIAILMGQNSVLPPRRFLIRRVLLEDFMDK